MTARGRRLTAQVLAVAVSLLIGAGEGLARGGGRGGGGGGGRGGGGGGGHMSGGGSYRGGSSNRQSVNRGGPASRGMGSAKRAQTRPSRPTGGQHAATRPGMDAGNPPGMSGSNRPGSGGAGRPGTTDRPKPGENRPDRADNQGNRQDNRTDREKDRQDFAKDRQEDRQDFWDNQIEDVDWNEVDWDEYEVHDHFEWNTGAWMALTVGTIITVGAWNSMTQQAGCNLESVEVNGQKYMKCGNTWYIEAWSGDQVHYVAVEPPV